MNISDATGWGNVFEMTLVDYFLVMSGKNLYFTTLLLIPIAGIIFGIYLLIRLCIPQLLTQPFFLKGLGILSLISVISFLPIITTIPSYVFEKKVNEITPILLNNNFVLKSSYQKYIGMYDFLNPLTYFSSTSANNYFLFVAPNSNYKYSNKMKTFQIIEYELSVHYNKEGPAATHSTVNVDCANLKYTIWDNPNDPNPLLKRELNNWDEKIYCQHNYNN